MPIKLKLKELIGIWVKNFTLTKTQVMKKLLLNSLKLPVLTRSYQMTPSAKFTTNKVKMKLTAMNRVEIADKKALIINWLSKLHWKSCIKGRTLSCTSRARFTVISVRGLGLREAIWRFVISARGRASLCRTLIWAWCRCKCSNRVTSVRAKARCLRRCVPSAGVVVSWPNQRLFKSMSSQAWRTATQLSSSARENKFLICSRATLYSRFNNSRITFSNGSATICTTIWSWGLRKPCLASRKSLLISMATQSKSNHRESLSLSVGAYLRMKVCLSETVVATSANFT